MEGQLLAAGRGEPNVQCFQLFGFDVMLDADMRPWLIEVNVSPDLAETAPLDKQLKHALAADMLHVVGVRMPGGAATATRRSSRTGGGGAPNSARNASASSTPRSASPTSYSPRRSSEDSGEHESRA